MIDNIATVFITPTARYEIQRDTSYLLQEAGENVAARFQQAPAASMLMIQQFPRLGRRCSVKCLSGSPMLRMNVKGRFPSWLIFYCLSESHIEVVHVLRRPADWQALLD